MPALVQLCEPINFPRGLSVLVGISAICSQRHFIKCTGCVSSITVGNSGRVYAHARSKVHCGNAEEAKEVDTDLTEKKVDNGWLYKARSWVKAASFELDRFVRHIIHYSL